tara:strand:+ start:38 stop:1180 length:1143 start_codon:yes stop_codon:yes gene_type:complete
MQSIYYWSPCLNKVGTLKSTVNSALSLSKYSRNKLNIKIINICGEWEDYKNIFSENNIEVIDFNFNYFKFLPKKGFFQSRFSYIIMILFSAIPLYRLLRKDKPKFIIIHLLTSLPLLLLSIFNFETNFILRISGYPKLNFWRKIFWKASSKKLKKITCPTKDLIEQLKELEIFQNKNIVYLPDAIINVKDFVNQIKENDFENFTSHKNKYFISVGRLTRQKNFSYLIDEFYEFTQKNREIDLLIFGDGDEKNLLQKKIKNKNLSNRIFLMGHSSKIYSYMKKAEAFILSSLWEEPGFVLIEAAMSNLFIVSSDCPNGPKEFLENGKAGLLFTSNKKNALKEKLEDFCTLKDKFKKKIKAKKNCFDYTMFRHSLYLREILS